MIADSPVAILRFWQVLSRANWGTHMFGVIRREMLQKTRLVPNFSGGDRAMLAELALLGRFRCPNEVLFSKRFHEGASCHLDEKEILGWLSTDGKTYSRRARQLKAYFATPRGKPVGLITKAGCVGLVAAHSVKTAAQALAGKDARRAVQGLAWRTTFDQHLVPLPRGAIGEPRMAAAMSEERVKLTISDLQTAGGIGPQRTACGTPLGLALRLAHTK